MKTCASLALIALANAVRIRDESATAQTFPDNVGIPPRSEFPSDADCTWLKAGGDAATATPKQASISEEDYNSGLWYCHFAAHCWESTPAGDEKPSAETMSCLVEKFSGKQPMTEEGEGIPASD